MIGLPGFLVVTKYAGTVPVSCEAYPVHSGRTPEQQYETSLLRELIRAKDADREQALATFWSTLLDLVVPGLAGQAHGAVLELHSPDTEARSWLTCQVCDGDDMDPGDWPCRTVSAIAEAYGIEVPQ